MKLVGPNEFRNSAEALLAASAAVAEEPFVTQYLNSLGIAQYRAGKWDEAIRSLNKSVEVNGSADSFDAFFLAMAHWQRGEKETARDWLKKAIAWMDQHAATNAELIEFRKEAEEIVITEM